MGFTVDLCDTEKLQILRGTLKGILKHRKTVFQILKKIQFASKILTPCIFFKFKILIINAKDFAANHIQNKNYRTNKSEI